MTGEIEGLEALARLNGIQTRYRDGFDREREAPATSVLAALRAMDVPLDGPDDVQEALRAGRAERARQIVEPTAVSWTSDEPAVELSVSDGADPGAVECRLELEDGTSRSWRTDLASLPASGDDGRRMSLPGPVPPGIHRMAVEAGGRTGRCHLIRAPSRAWTPEEERGPVGEGSAARGAAASDAAAPRGWGLFLPLHALRSRRDWGVGDFHDLGRLLGWTGERGGEALGVLPLHACYLDQPFQPSPYVPVSRLFWNELFVAPDAVADLDRAPAACRLLASDEVRRRRTTLRDRSRVDYREAAALKRTALEALTRDLAPSRAEAPPELRRFVEETPHLERYARFRAVGERTGRGWRSWDEPARSGDLGGVDPDAEEVRYHLVAQWLAARQLGRAAAAGAEAGAGLYLDVPLGTHPEGFDTWRRPELFARGISAGAPPDAFFSEGQKWGFPPLAPEAMRRNGYGYWRACLDAVLARSSLLRVDHVMGLHRLFWVPDGAPATEGVYVRYPAEELYAVLCLASREHRTEIVGEDLGTVPPEVREAMDAHGLRRMYVVPFEVEVEDAGHEPAARLPDPRPDALAALNTHDLPTWAGWWRGRDLELRSELGQLDDGAAAEERRSRLRTFGALERGLGLDAGDAEGEPDDERLRTALRETLHRLAAGPARFLLLNLEDLWLEEAQQNLPGTDGEHPNWRSRARYRMDEFRDLPGVVETLERIDRERADDVSDGGGGST